MRPLVDYPPKLSVSVLFNVFKGMSSRMLRQERPDLAERYSKKGAAVGKLLCRSNGARHPRNGPAVCRTASLLLAMTGAAFGGEWHDGGPIRSIDGG